MNSKTKIHQKRLDKLTEAVQNAGILLMTAAVTVGMLELPDHPNNRIILPNQPSFVAVTQNGEQNNPLRREREETAPHYISYNVTQRTPSRSGRH